VPDWTTRAIPSSSAICHATSTGSAFIPPPTSNGRGASRVQSTTPSGNGSPEATPKEKGESENEPVRATAPATRVESSAAAAKEALPAKKDRRLSAWTPGKGKSGRFMWEKGSKKEGSS
jgi:hypothetical protein